MYIYMEFSLNPSTIPLPPQLLQLRRIPIPTPNNHMLPKHPQTQTQAAQQPFFSLGRLGFVDDGLAEGVGGVAFGC